MSYKGKLTIYVDTIRKVRSTPLRGHNTNIKKWAPNDNVQNFKTFSGAIK
jgi:hypothetical protein